jgi:hypothetical protein
MRTTTTKKKRRGKTKAIYLISVSGEIFNSQRVLACELRVKFRKRRTKKNSHFFYDSSSRNNGFYQFIKQILRSAADGEENDS